MARSARVMNMVELVLFKNENEAGKQLAIDSAPKTLDLGTRALQAHDPFWILPYELTSKILLHLPSTDILNLRLSFRKITLTKLPMKFWKSKFWPRNELGFAKSLCCPKTCTWENWYVFVREQCKSGPKHKNLMNQKRIWHLAGYLVELVSIVKSRIVLGSPTLDLSLGRSRKVTCVPPKKFSGGYTVRVGIHGEFWSQITLNKHYDSVQASVASAGAEYREHGQVTSLLFRPSGSEYPELISQ
ncbi:MAG: hypothetical protein M1840_006900 [Geoglossum simile]|nr:MAG: hypothetical protein M1840_006900 [Geoglossum simile]